MKFMKLSFDYHKMDFNVDFIDVERGDLLKDCYNEIGCEIVDMVSIDDTFTAIIDDEGLLKSGNPVFEFSNGYHFAGNILIATTKIKEDLEVELDSVNIERAFEFLSKYKARLVGVTK